MHKNTFKSIVANNNNNSVTCNITNHRLHSSNHSNINNNFANAKVSELIDKINILLNQFQNLLDEISKNKNKYPNIDLQILELAIFVLKYKLLPAILYNLNFPLVVTIIGGTNVGKSTIVNSFFQARLSEVSSLASKTKHIFCIGTKENLEKMCSIFEEFSCTYIDTLYYYNCIDNSKPIDTDKPSKLFLILVDEKTSTEILSFRDLPIILDTPDIDSTDTRCRQITKDSLKIADVIVWVTTQQKYKDEASLNFLDFAMNLNYLRVDVFNQSLDDHKQAIEDMLIFYGQKWNKNERYFFSIPYCKSSYENGFIPYEQISPIANKLVELNKSGRKIKAKNVIWAILNVSPKVANTITEIQKVYDQWQEIKIFFQNEFESTLFQPLKHLPGHYLPYEIQNIIIKVLKPKIKSNFSEYLEKVSVFANSIISAFFNVIFHKSDNCKRGNITFCEELIKERDQKDFMLACNIVNTAKKKLYEIISTKTASDKLSPIWQQFLVEFRSLHLLESEVLQNKFKDYLPKGINLYIKPVLNQFEEDFRNFCDKNPVLISSIKALVPSFSVLVALASAIISIQTFAFLPGAAEYLLAGVAFPVLDKLQTVLPHQLLTLAEHLSNEKIILNAKARFIEARQQLFLQLALWLIEPINKILELNKIDTSDIEKELYDIYNSITEFFKSELINK